MTGVFDETEGGEEGSGLDSAGVAEKPREAAKVP
jgi:hypothetical protein